MRAAINKTTKSSRMINIEFSEHEHVEKKKQN